MSKVSMVSLGCPKNQVDGEIILNKLKTGGYEIVNEIENSDIVIVNTCGFIEDAKREAIETILDVAEYKKESLISAIVVTGCLAERYQDQILEEMPEVDAVIGIGANADIVKICDKALCGIKTSVFPNKCYLPIDDERLVSTPNHWAYLKISEGCDNKCSYCAIPNIRGAFRSRKIESIVAEAKNLVKNGVREIILIAQDTTKYGFDIYKKLALVDLLQELVKIDELVWIRLLYCYPDRITDELINCIRDNEKICNYIDIPLQHANGEVLKKMNRFGNSKTLTELIDKMRKNIPNIAIRTTFMVGFPGETNEQFEELAIFNKNIKFDKMGCFNYSPEEDTPAERFENQIDETLKKERAESLLTAQYDITLKINQDKIGKTFSCVIDEFDEEQKLYIARGYFDSPEIDSVIYVKTKTNLSIGEFYNIEIERVEGYDLFGKVVN